MNESRDGGGLFVNVADLRDPHDKQGRTYRQVNAETLHVLSVGELVEMENGARLFISRLTRDCDMTPLYSLAPELEPVYSEYDERARDGLKRIWESKQIHGYCKDSLSRITADE